MDNIKNRIIESTQNGCFLEFIYGEFLKNKQEDYELTEILAELHNESKINVLTEFNDLNNSKANLNFFILRDIFAKLLPLINAPISQVKSSVKILTIKAGNDMDSHGLIQPFISFCEKDINRANELFNQELENIDEEFDLISSALIAGSRLDKNNYLNKATELLKHENLIIVQRAIFAISRFDFSDDLDIALIIAEKIISAHSDSSNELLLKNKVRTLIILAAKYENLDSCLLKFLDSQNGNNEPNFLYAIASQLHYKQNELSYDIKWNLFQFFKDIDPINKGIYQQIDSFIYYCIVNEKDDFRKIVIYLDCLIKNNPSFKLSFIPTSIDKLREAGNSEIIKGIVTFWFLKKEIQFCYFASELLQTGTIDQIEIEYDTNQIKPTDVCYLSNKAIGWFEFQPLTALNLIISIYPLIEVEQEEVVTENVWSYIAMNYPNQAKDFFLRLTKSENQKIKRLSETILNLLANYQNNLAKLYSIKELRPNINQRIAYNNFHQEMMENAVEKSDKHSIVDLLYPHKKVVLYGNKFIHKQKDFNHNEVRQVIPFSSFSTSVDYPRLEHLTPHTFRYKINEFKTEGL